MQSARPCNGADLGATARPQHKRHLFVLPSCPRAAAAADGIGVRPQTRRRRPTAARRDETRKTAEDSDAEMKFGKRLTSEAARRWGTEYLDYKAVKRALKEDLRQGGE